MVQVAFSHPLGDPNCECRHNLSTEERVSRGVSANALRTGKCLLTLRAPLTVSGYGLGSVRINLSNSGVNDDDMLRLCGAIRSVQPSVVEYFPRISGHPLVASMFSLKMKVLSQLF